MIEGTSLAFCPLDSCCFLVTALPPWVGTYSVFQPSRASSLMGVVFAPAYCWPASVSKVEVPRAPFLLSFPPLRDHCQLLGHKQSCK